MTLPRSLMILLFCPTAWATLSPSEVNPRDFGFSHELFKQSDGNKVVIFRDIQNGKTLRTSYSPLGQIEWMEERTHGGKLLERRELNGVEIVIENFEPAHRKLVFRPTHQPHIQQLEVTEKTPQETFFSTYLIPWEHAFHQCRSSEKNLIMNENLFTDLSWLQFKPTGHGKTVDLGNHLMAENCEKFPNGGLQRIAQAVNDGLKKGLSCLSKLNDSGKMNAAKLLSFFEKNAAKKGIIYCGHPGETVIQGKDPSSTSVIISRNYAAHSFPRDIPNFPGLYLNLDYEEFQKNPNSVSSTIFHEMMHWLGYPHGEGIDVAYLAETCCTSNPELEFEKIAQKESCSLLKDSPKFTSAEYHRRFSRIMKHIFISSVPLQAAWNASFQTPPLQAGKLLRRDSSPLMASVLASAEEDLSLWKKDAREKGHLLSHLILGKAGLKNLPENSRAKYEAEFQKTIQSLYPSQDIRSKLSEYLGNAMNGILNRDGKSFESAWKSFQLMRTQACSQLSRSEKDQLRETLDLASVELFDVRPSMTSYNKDFTHPCPE